MSEVVSGVPVRYDPYSLECHRDPYPVYRLLRGTAPIYYNEERDFWALTRFDDVQAALRDWKRFSSAPGNDIDPVGTQFGTGNFIDLDPPRHKQLRDTVRGQFAARTIHARENSLRAIAEGYLSDLARRRAGDL